MSRIAMKTSFNMKNYQDVTTLHKKSIMREPFEELFFSGDTAAFAFFQTLEGQVKMIRSFSSPQPFFWRSPPSFYFIFLVQ